MLPPGYSIRELTPSDLETVLHHRRMMFHDMGHTDPAGLDAMTASSRPHFAALLANGRYKGWFVEDSAGAVVAGGGIIISDYHANVIDPSPRRPLIVNMYTEPAHRRMGLARIIMETMIRWCKAEGFGTVVLHASDEGKPLYASLGFKDSNEMKLKLK